MDHCKGFAAIAAAGVACMAVAAGCSSAKESGQSPAYVGLLEDSISSIVARYPGEIGVAVIVNDSDTAAVNDSSVYPMMSVFKLHQALAVCHDLDRRGVSLDSVVTLRRDSLAPDTWSPMLKEHQEAEIKLPVGQLLCYTLTSSDNNASNYMFHHLVGVAATDSLIATMIPRDVFRIAYSEDEMQADHDKAYSNYTSPLGAAMLINRVFTDSLVSREKQAHIKTSLAECITGADRIVAPLLGRHGVSVAHKTGSGYVNERGELVAHNDVAYICLPNGVSYSLAVFVKDFKGSEAQASESVARISDAVYSILSALP